jgi:hypothetical protein
MSGRRRSGRAQRRVELTRLLARQRRELVKVLLDLRLQGA